MTEVGTILDHLGRTALIAVAQGDRTLNDAYTAAEQARDAEREKLDRKERRVG